MPDSYAKRRNRRQSELVEIDGRMINPTVPIHGVTASGYPNGYVNYLCRCCECTVAWADWCADRRDARRARRVEGEGRRMVAVGVEHGTVNAATNYGCRCRACSLANVAARKRWARYA